MCRWVLLMVERIHCTSTTGLNVIIPVRRATPKSTEADTMVVTVGLQHQEDN